MTKLDHTPGTRCIYVDDLNRRPRHIIISPDRRTAGRIYADFPPFVSMTPAQVIELANELIDILEREVDGIN